MGNMYALFVIHNPLVLLFQMCDLVLRSLLIFLHIRDLVRDLTHPEFSLVNGLFLVLDRTLEGFEFIIEAFECSELVFEFSVMAVVRGLSKKMDGVQVSG